MQKSRGLFGILIITILLSSIVLAQTNSTNITGIDIKSSTSKLDSKLDQNVKIPETLQILTRIVFGIGSGEEVTVSAFILLLFIWAWIFVIVAEALKLTPFFKGKTIWIGSAVITILIALTKTILEIARFWLDIGSSFKFLAEWPTGEFVISIMGLILAIILTFFLKDWLDKRMKKIKSEEEIDEIEEGIKIIKESSKELKAKYK